LNYLLKFTAGAIDFYRLNSPTEFTTKATEKSLQNKNSECCLWFIGRGWNL